MSFAKRFCRVMLCVILLLVVYILATVSLTAQDETTKFRAIECENILIKNSTDSDSLVINSAGIVRVSDNHVRIMIGKVFPNGNEGIMILGKDRRAMLGSETLGIYPSTPWLYDDSSDDAELGGFNVIIGYNSTSKTSYLGLSDGGSTASGAVLIPTYLLFRDEKGNVVSFPKD